MIRLVAATSSANEVNGFWTQTTWKPFFSSKGTTLDQLDPSAHAPCTRTMLWIGCVALFCPLAVSGRTHASKKEILNKLKAAGWIFMGKSLRGNRSAR